jgi:hypothetical protein
VVDFFYNLNRKEKQRQQSSPNNHQLRPNLKQRELHNTLVRDVNQNRRKNDVLPLKNCFAGTLLKLMGL